MGERIVPALISAVVAVSILIISNYIIEPRKEKKESDVSAIKKLVCTTLWNDIGHGYT